MYVLLQNHVRMSLFLTCALICAELIEQLFVIHFASFRIQKLHYGMSDVKS
jgi:hypothetical protein